MWAVGCIISELFLRRPLLPGESYLNQLIRIVNLIGSPTEEDLASVQSERAKQFIKNLGFREKVDLKLLFQNTLATPEIIDLIEKLLGWNPVIKKKNNMDRK